MVSIIYGNIKTKLYENLTMGVHIFYIYELLNIVNSNTLIFYNSYQYSFAVDSGQKIIGYEGVDL